MIVDKALWVIERNADQPLTLAAVAEACGVSRSHLAAAFASATGTPLIRYLRARRLSEAARALVEGAPDILSVALTAGYGSHEAFTRAFRDQFGVTPEAARENGLEPQALVAPLDLRPSAGSHLAPPRFERAGAIRAVGLARTVTFDTVVEIPAQWRRFMARHDEIPDALENAIPIGVCDPADENGAFAYVAAAEVARFMTIPKGLDRLEIPARACAVFEHTGHVSTIFKTYTAIWNEALPATGRSLADGPVVEQHNRAFDPETGEGGLTLWIPVTG
ncbi:AraC family transcriptional regulator [Brevundimonas sp.]|uniref:AraC family transcriptional regulator n=1 Tax=Brevundimonas sp. TaxID=1871086 RepID=UPI003D0DE30B